MTGRSLEFLFILQLIQERNFGTLAKAFVKKRSRPGSESPDPEVLARPSVRPSNPYYSHMSPDWVHLGHRLGLLAFVGGGRWGPGRNRLRSLPYPIRSAAR